MSDSPTFFWRQLALPKRGHRLREYEDAARGDPVTGRFAVADGASESSYSGLWAELLAEAFVASPPSPDIKGRWLEPIQARWRDTVPSDDLPWFAEIKRDEEGASATLLGVEFNLHDPERLTWTATAVGDACLLQLRAGRIRRCFPLQAASEFDNQPDLLNSIAVEPPRFRRTTHRVRPGDRFLLATDALAHWCLTRHEEHADPCPEFEPFWAHTSDDLQAPFVELIDRLRDSEGLRNDDVTLILVEPLL